MRVHGAASAAVTKEGAAAIASLANAGRFFRMRLRDIGACEGELSRLLIFLPHLYFLLGVELLCTLLCA